MAILYCPQEHKSMRKFIMLQLWLGILIIGGYFVYKRTTGKDEYLTPPPASMETVPLEVTLPDNYVKVFELPDTLSFAGEPVPLHMTDVRERLDREIHVNSYWHSSTIFLIKRSNRWLPLLEDLLNENGIPTDFKYLSVIESGLENVVSPKQAVGFWQIREGTGNDFGLEINREVDQRYDPIASTAAAAKYMLKAKEKFGNWTNVAASYNMGMKGLADELEEQKTNSYYDLLLNEETSRYMFRLLAIKEILEHPKKYGYDIPQELLYPVIPLDTLRVTEDIPSLVDFAQARGLSYKELRLHNPWLRRGALNVRKGKSYLLRLPKGHVEVLPTDNQADALNSGN